MRNSIIEHKGNMFYVELREDYLLVCQQCTYRKQVKGQIKSKASPYCKAFILSIMESWTNNKRGSGKLAVFMSYRQWSDEMYGMFGRTIIIDSIDELIGEGLLSREAYKMSTGQDTFQYTLNYKEVNKRIYDLPEGKANVTRPKIDGSHQSKSEQVPVQKKTGTNSKVDGYPSISSHNVSSTQNQLNINTEDRSDVAGSQEKIPTSDQSIYSLEEKQILDWYERLGTGYTPKPETAKKSLPILIEHVHSFEDMQSLYDFTAKKITGEDKTVYLANMTKFIKMWMKNKPVVEAPQPDMPELTVEESEELVLWASRPSTIERLFAQNATMEVHMSTLGKSLRMMTHSEAREYGYDVVVQHYSPEQVEWYRQKTETRELIKIAG